MLAGLYDRFIPINSENSQFTICNISKIPELKFPWKVYQHEHTNYIMVSFRLRC